MGNNCPSSHFNAFLRMRFHRASHRRRPRSGFCAQENHSMKLVYRTGVFPRSAPHLALPPSLRAARNWRFLPEGAIENSPGWSPRKRTKSWERSPNGSHRPGGRGSNPGHNPIPVFQIAMTAHPHGRRHRSAFPWLITESARELRCSLELGPRRHANSLRIAKCFRHYKECNCERICNFGKNHS